MRTYVILFRYDLIKDPVPESAVHIKVHTQLHSATTVLRIYPIRRIVFDITLHLFNE